ncbi:MAG: hypothetical protein GX564_13555 [Oligosphaeraceae bacterium]|nr:hypothetical protein [Oligosphaeraceae bacterium]
MTTQSLQLIPRDLLFLRDARPMAAADAGQGGNWPRPDQLWNAVCHTMHRTWPEQQDWEGLKHRKTDLERTRNPDSSDRFGALQSIGPFPFKAGKPFFPCPLDLGTAPDSGQDTSLLKAMTLLAGEFTNLPQPLKYAFSAPALSKEALPAWLSQDEYQKYLEGTATITVQKNELYDLERNIGIAIDPETGTARDKEFYQAEYLRLRHDVSLACQLDCQITPKTSPGQDRTKVDVLDKLQLQNGLALILGGQQGVVYSQSCNWHLPAIPKPDEDFRLLRWTLLSPAVFPHIVAAENNGHQEHPGGWLPTWINPQDGRVLLPATGPDSARRPGEDRRLWRQRRQELPAIQARLIAARVGKPQYFSGWDSFQGPKPTLAAVPAGSVYLFQCDSQQNASLLWDALSWQGQHDKINRRSTVFGEKGFGLGVCSVGHYTW